MDTLHKDNVFGFQKQFIFMMLSKNIHYVQYIDGQIKAFYITAKWAYPK